MVIRLFLQTPACGIAPCPPVFHNHHPKRVTTGGKMPSASRTQLIAALRMIFLEMAAVVADRALPMSVRMRAWRIVTRISALLEG